MGDTVSILVSTLQLCVYIGLGDKGMMESKLLFRILLGIAENWDC